MLLRNMLPVNVVSYLFLFLLTFCVVYPFPSVPLNQRNQDITWQMWLLVNDDQHNNQRIDSDVMPRKRITPKSIFIAPTFNFEDLPSCAEGYTLDSRNNCIKIIKLDESKHLDFLVDQLAGQFSDNDYEEEVIDIAKVESTEGPVQFSIPLFNSNGDYSNDAEEESNFAIMFTPVEKSNENEESTKIDKRDEKTDTNNDSIETTTKTDEQNTEEDIMDDLVESTTLADETTLKDFTTTMVNNDKVDFTTKTLQNEETTTIDDNTFKNEKLIDESKGATTTQKSTTTFTDSYETTTLKNLDETTIMTESTTQVENSKPESIKIIIDTNEYFTTESDVVTEIPTTNTEESSTQSLSTPKITTYHPISTKVTTYHPNFNFKKTDQGHIRFPEPRNREVTVEPKIDFVKFPDIENQEESIKHHTRDVGGQVGNFVNEFEGRREEKRRFKFPDEVGTHRLATNGEKYEYAVEASTPKPRNRRNREKHNFFLSPEMMDSLPHKPSLPQEDLSFLFGHKRTNRQTKSSKTDVDKNR